MLLLGIKIALGRNSRISSSHTATESAQAASPSLINFSFRFSSFSSHFSLKLISIYLFARSLAQHFALTHFHSFSSRGVLLSALLAILVVADALGACRPQSIPLCWFVTIASSRLSHTPKLKARAALSQLATRLLANLEKYLHCLEF